MPTQEGGRTILVGEDEPEIQAYLQMALECLGYAVELAHDGEEVLNCLASSRSVISAVLLDILMPGMNGIDTLREIRRIDAHLPVIMLSGAFTTNNIVTTMKSGATDFLCKPVAHEDLQLALHKAIEKQATLIYSLPARALPHINALPHVNKAFVGRSSRMQEIQALIPHLGSSEIPILIQGETGSGKEVFAREIHANSARAKQVFLKLNCAALPSELVESELFGYERGAFTGAFQRRAGMFEMANGGTLLLDEIGDMDVRLQAKLLQVLQDHEFQRIGGKELIKVDVRVLAATHRDLESAIVEGTFREDLYYRLNVINIELPPLRERKEDIIPLTEYLLRKRACPQSPVPAITPNLKHALVTYPWPGNVRELENIVRRLIVLRSPELVASELLAKASRKRLLLAPPDSNGTPQIVETTAKDTVKSSVLEQVTKAKQQAEAQAILAALDSTRWNRKQAAVLLQIDYKALLYKLKKLGLEDKPVSFNAESAALPLHSRGSGNGS
jgi:two-component system response regulator AtoC